MSVPRELRGLVKLLDQRAAGDGGGELRFEQVKEPGLCEVSRRGGAAVIRYAAPAMAGRGLGALLGGLVGPGETCREATPFRMLGVMLDCSRNAVMTAEHLREVWLPRLALLGYNMLMLYTEDTYELPGEPYFGYKRGAYTADELRSVVAAAAALNIEVIPCIQTLGHLEQILKHEAYAPVRDTSSVMLVGEPKTYALIEKMIAHWSRLCPTRRIHVGMDETCDLGCGRYLDRRRHRRGFDLFSEHLARVARICRKHGVKPMLWSDMCFRLGCRSGGCYDPATVIPPRVVRKIPREADFVYWDYFHDDPAFYLDRIARHRAMGREPLVGSGIWTWNRYWYDYRRTEFCAGACIRACYQAGIKEVFFTMWGDNGAYCDHDSAFAGMTFCADIAFGARKPDAARLEKRFAAVCGGNYAANRLGGDIHRGAAPDLDPNMWDDPFFETGFRRWAGDNPRLMAKAARAYGALAGRLKRNAGDRNAGDCLHAFRVARAFAERYALSAALLAPTATRTGPPCGPRGGASRAPCGGDPRHGRLVPGHVDAPQQARGPGDDPGPFRRARSPVPGNGSPSRGTDRGKHQPPRRTRLPLPAGKEEAILRRVRRREGIMLFPGFPRNKVMNAPEAGSAVARDIRSSTA
ncbi:MAG: beta-N-acetylhexosaminidase [Verrucomicrobiota bacterium]|nr:beta-N-acetylhexosaminidase [Verrucomicrobiota bacterium]